MTSLRNRLVLHRFICHEFGYLRGLAEMLGRLRGLSAGSLDTRDESEYATALWMYRHRDRAKVTREQFVEYDANIAALSHRLRMAGAHGRTWKPHQYLALLFTEHYLSRYFTDPELLRAELNEAKRRNRLTWPVPDYTPEDLRTVAFQSATGSGKTLIMHAHILQYRHWLDRAGKRLNNIILVTPNEQMSAQHERDLRESGLHARIFSGDAGADLFAPIEIIDLNKLAERKGVKRVAVRDFGENNLVLVDEGHLGASGKVWRERRGELARGGFAFEYSATFNQIAGKDESLRDAYGKCLLFDYPYHRFHADGYGKDYAIANLPSGMRDENSDMYLLGCLLTFYQQCRIWRDKGALWRDFNLAKPLWVFLGKTVTGRSRADEATRSDVVVILDFLGRFLADGATVRAMVDRLLSGRSGLVDNAGGDYFADRFRYLHGDRSRSLDRLDRLDRLARSHRPDQEDHFGRSGHPDDPDHPSRPADLYADICETLFHGQGRLHVVYLTAGEGELHLRVADGPVFGVVNVGDSAALHRMLVRDANPDLHVEREAGFAERLFASVDRPDSTVNVVIGARRFIAGWNSWRVSTMGLMHVGIGEGPEVIQTFGRGVRLRGWNMSLKRHSRSGAASPADSDDLAELERLYVFGLRASYMLTFRDLLDKEGIRTERETIRLPVTWNFARKTDLKMLRLATDRKYERSENRPVLPGPGDKDSPRVVLDLYSRLRAESSNGAAAAGGGEGKRLIRLGPGHVALFDRTRMHDKLLARKRQRGWHNLSIEPDIVDRLFTKGRSDWYELYAPPEKLHVTGFRQVRALEDIAVDLVTEYADQFWRKRRRRWEHEQIEVVALAEDDPNNVEAWELSVDATEARLIGDIHRLASHVQEGSFDYRSLDLRVILARAHAWQPLLARLPVLHAGKDREVTVQPVPLDESERQVVEGLAALAENGDPCLSGRELFLIRNRTHGRGVSFFDDFSYYPDFIVWLKDGDHQHVVFLDPKGLSRFGGKERRKVRLHHEIAEVEKRVSETDPRLRLHAYVLSATPPALIDDGKRSAGAWKEDGVYFLSESDCLKQVVGHALEAERTD